MNSLIEERQREEKSIMIDSKGVITGRWMCTMLIDKVVDMSKDRSIYLYLHI